MKIVIVGPGALGCLLAATLREGSQDVLLMDYIKGRAETITRQGIIVHESGRESVVPVPATAEPERAEGADLIIVCVKAYRTAEAIAPLVPFIHESRVLTLQNGLGNVEILVDACGRDRVWGGVTAQGATLMDTGRIRHAGTGDTVFGAVSPPDDRLAEVADIFNRSGLPAGIESNVDTLIWSKLIVNVGINALCAITRLRNGRLLEYEGTRRIMDNAVQEAASVVRALGVRLLYDDPHGRVHDVARATAENIASMLQDVLAKRPTEIDWINGAISAKGRELGIPTPVNGTLTGLVKTIESTYKLHTTRGPS